MGIERRQHRRVVQPFEGRYSGASGNNVCRIADISIGGCFVQSLAAPAPGEAVVVTVEFRTHTVALPGRVIYIDAGMGFSVRFEDLTPQDLETLTLMLAAFEAASA